MVGQGKEMTAMSGGQSEIHACEVCSTDRLVTVLDLGLHPMCDDLVRIGDSRVCREYPIEILFCRTCCTAHQRFQIPKHELFPASYHYRSRFTNDVLNGMAGLVASCSERFDSLAGKTVLDVGCSDGSLLDFFHERGAITIGIEPTNACSEAAQKGHSTFNEFLSENVAGRIVALHGHPDFITFTNVFAHIEDLRQVLETLRVLMHDRTVLVIENHYLGAILDNNQFDTFYHEHPRSYSYTSFVYIARELNRELLHVEFPSRYGGNIRVFLGKRQGALGSVNDQDRGSTESHFLQNFQIMRENIVRWRKNKLQTLQNLTRERGKLRAKAFPGRAAILVKMLELTDASISAVYEKPGSLKIGNYLPGTRIPILSDENLFASADRNQLILNLSWHISGEIRSYLKSNDYIGPVIDILNPEDFVAH